MIAIAKIGKPCKYGHNSGRNSCRQCIACIKIKLRDPEYRKRRAIAQRLYAERDRGNVRRILSKYRMKNPLKTNCSRLLASAKKRAAYLSMDYDLDLAWVVNKVSAGVCEVSGIPFEMSASRIMAQPFSPSLDRIDREKGYTKDNCRIILWGLNVSFNWWGEETFRKIMDMWIENGFLEKNSDSIPG